MNKILTIPEAIAISRRLTTNDQQLVLAGGCFDILHIGHIEFLKKAKEQGDYLMVLLESDKNITKWKGAKRPFNSQKDRTKILSALEIIDYVVPLPTFDKDEQYDNLVISVKPAIIAATENDLGLRHIIRQASQIGAKVVEVTPVISDYSTTKIAKLLEEI